MDASISWSVIHGSPKIDWNASIAWIDRWLSSNSNSTRQAIAKHFTSSSHQALEHLTEFMKNVYFNCRQHDQLYDSHYRGSVDSHNRSWNIIVRFFLKSWPYAYLTYLQWPFKVKLFLTVHDHRGPFCHSKHVVLRWSDEHSIQVWVYGVHTTEINMTITVNRLRLTALNQSAEWTFFPLLLPAGSVINIIAQSNFMCVYLPSINVWHIP